MDSNIRIKIRDWEQHFERDRSKQWQSLKWVPVPNKQGLGYKKIMLQKNGAEIFGCWNALVQQASLCSPRGDLSKYSILDLSLNTMIPLDTLSKALDFILQNLDWIEVVEILDINVNENDISVSVPAVGSSMLSSVILSSPVLSSTSSQDGGGGEGKAKKRRHGEYKHVLLTEKEYDKLLDDFGESRTANMIKKLDEGIEMKGYKYKNHNLALRKWEKNPINSNTAPRRYGRVDLTPESFKKQMEYVYKDAPKEWLE